MKKARKEADDSAKVIAEFEKKAEEAGTQGTFVRLVAGNLRVFCREKIEELSYIPVRDEHVLNYI